MKDNPFQIYPYLPSSNRQMHEEIIEETFSLELLPNNRGIQAKRRKTRKSNQPKKPKNPSLTIDTYA